ncbi:MAG TPA: crotonase/enoyl-CoA hydratase family protein [Acidimicrobiales bacterium]|nr:crotonase/enoyl-CoA hydratase family protein [Acidimicrobiales bacterium]
MSDPAVLVERDDHVVTITLNRPDKRNAFDAEMLCRLADAWDTIDADDGVRAAVMTGAGGHFSAGADLDRLVGALLSGKPAANEFEERIQADVGLIYKGFLKDFRPATPIVAAVEGYCYAGGIEILQAFDVRVAAEGARIAVSEVQRGLFPMSGSTVRLPRQIPWTVAMEMLITGEPISGRRAYEIGLVGHVVPDGTALARAREIAGRIARNGPLAVRNIKASVLAADALPEGDAYGRELELGLEVMGSRDAKEGPKAFLEKREPDFTGA